MEDRYRSSVPLRPRFCECLCISGADGAEQPGSAAAAGSSTSQSTGARVPVTGRCSATASAVGRRMGVAFVVNSWVSPQVGSATQRMRCHLLSGRSSLFPDSSKPPPQTTKKRTNVRSIHDVDEPPFHPGGLVKRCSSSILGGGVCRAH